MNLRILVSVLLFFIFSSSVISAERKMAIQINSSDPVTQKMALLNARNLKAVLGKDNIDVELVVYGPGLSLIKTDKLNSARVEDLMKRYGLKVSVCEGTLKRYAKKNGVEADIIDGVSRVSTGAIRLLELQEKGYSYLRP